jgi:hypothetical protein
MIVTRRAATLGLGAAFLAASGCASTFRTFYDSGVPPEVSRGWRIADVRVAVPATLSVSEAKTLLPKADIVWREDPEGDRRAQVAAIVETAARQGGSGLRGSRAVILDITVSRFHALTFEAERRMSNAGVHNIDFTIQVVDASSGQVLAGPDAIEAALPALSGAAMVEARRQGQTQKSQITAHLRATIAGWLGAGPDARRSFSRMGN